jgi:hypothetical protein
MTDAGRPRPSHRVAARRRRRCSTLQRSAGSGSRAVRVVARSSGLFFGPRRRARDPGAARCSAAAAAAAAPPREIVKRKVVLTRIVVHERRAREQVHARGDGRPPLRDAPPRSRGARSRPATTRHVMTADLTFPCMGSQALLIVDSQATRAICRAFLEDFEAALSRFPGGQRALPPQRGPARTACPPRSCCARRARRVWAPSARAGSSIRRSRPRSRRPATRARRRAPELRLADALASRPRAPRHRRTTTRSGACPRRPTTTHAPSGLRLRQPRHRQGPRADLLAARLDTAARRAPAGVTPRGVGRRLRWRLRVLRRRRRAFRVDGSSPHRRAMRELTLTRGAVGDVGIDVRLWRGCRRISRTPSARSVDRRAGVERPESATTGARSDRARRRGAGEGRAALGPATRRRLADRHGGLDRPRRRRTSRRSGRCARAGRSAVRRRPRPVMA